MNTGETTKRVVIQETIPTPMISGLAELIDRYYLTPNPRELEAFSYEKSAQNADGYIDFRWKISTEFIAKGRQGQTPHLLWCSGSRISLLQHSRRLASGNCTLSDTPQACG